MAVSDLPVPRNGLQDRPTLLYSWWCTIFAMLLILARLAARKIRIDKLFIEDYFMACTIIPLFIRMGLVQIVLNDGTNNVDPSNLTGVQLLQREYGSKIVLAARVFFALTLWCSQGATLEFILRNFIKGSTRARRFMFIAARSYFGVSLLLSICTIVFACEPISHAWQVSPTPPPVCHQGYPGFIVTGVLLICTNVVSVCYPVWVVSTLRLPTTKKVVLTILFCAPLALVVVTSIRLPAVIARGGEQQYRTVWASTEIMTEIFTGNMLILGSYARGTGAKRVRYYGGRGGKSDPRSDHMSNGRGRHTRDDRRGSEEKILRGSVHAGGGIDQFGDRLDDMEMQNFGH